MKSLSKFLTALFFVFAIGVNSLYSQIVEYNIDLPSSTGGTISGMLKVDLDAPASQYFGQEIISSKAGLVVEANLVSVSPSGTTRNFTLDSNPNGDALEDIVPDEVSSGWSATVVESEDSLTSPASWNLPQDFSGSGILIGFAAEDQEGVKDTILFGITVDGSTFGSDFPLETPGGINGDCVGFARVTSDSENVTSFDGSQTGKFFVGPIGIAGQFAELISMIENLETDGTLSSRLARQLNNRVSKALNSFEQGRKNQSIIMLWRAKLQVLWSMFRGATPAEEGTQIVDDLDSLIITIYNS